MARRKSRAKKIQNAVHTLRFSVPTSTAPQYLDISAAASIVNRRFYRQGLQWAVAGFTVIAPPNTTNSLLIKKLPTNWVVSNSWEKGMRSWMQQQNEALADGDLQSIKAKYNDFKIYADAAHANGPTPHFLLPKDGDGTAFLAPDEWLHSEVVIPPADTDDATVTTEFKLHMMGADNGAVSKSLIKAYADSRSVPQSPDPSTPTTASTGLYSLMFNDGMANPDILANAEFRNDELPYNQDAYPGSATNGPGMELVDTLQINTTTTQLGKYSMNGGSFPCGIVKIENTLSDIGEGQTIDLLVHLVPGTHRGYLAENMVDM